MAVKVSLFCRTKGWKKITKSYTALTPREKTKKYPGNFTILVENSAIVMYNIKMYSYVDFLLWKERS